MICLAVVLVLVLVLKDSLRTYFKSLSLSLSLGIRSLSLGGQVQEVLVLGGQVLVLVLGGQVLVLVGQVLVNIPAQWQINVDPFVRPTTVKENTSTTPMGIEVHSSNLPWLRVEAVHQRRDS